MKTRSGLRLYRTLSPILLVLVIALTTHKAGYTQSRLYTWGFNGQGQLGTGNTISRMTPGDVKAPDGSAMFAGASAIAAGESHTLILKSDRTIYSLGYNFFGQLGDNSATNRSIPVQVKGANNSGVLTDIIAVAAGQYHSVALKANGTVWAWGANGQGQLGDNTITQRRTPVQVRGPGNIGFLTRIVAIAAGSNHTLALRRDGTVFGWGFNTNGQLGCRNFASSRVPVPMLNAEGSGPLRDIVGIAAGGDHSLALSSSGGVFACGINNIGQLGDGTTVSRNLPARVLGWEGFGLLESVVAISAGLDHSLALSLDGVVYAWGDNFFGQSGDGTTNTHTIPVLVKGTNGAGLLTDVAALSAGRAHTLALTSNGSVFAWGYNGQGQLGEDTTEDRLTPVQVKGPDGLGVLENIVTIAAGGFHSVALYSPSVIHGRVSLQSAASSAGIAIRFEFRPVAGGEALLRPVILGPQGSFTITDIPTGTYHVAVKGSKWLQRVVPDVNTVYGNALDLQVFLLTGDANNDNAVDVFDLDTLIQAFDAMEGDPNWNGGIADFNSDESVDVLDLDLLIQNFDLLGDL